MSTQGGRPGEREREEWEERQEHRQRGDEEDRAQSNPLAEGAAEECAEHEGADGDDAGAHSGPAQYVLGSQLWRKLIAVTL